MFVCGTDVAEITEKLGDKTQLLVQDFQTHCLAINVTKTNFLLIGTDKRKVINVNIKLKVGKTEVEQVAEAKYLGVTIDRNLKLQTQVKSILRKMAMGIRKTQCIRDSMPLKTRLAPVRALVISH